MDTNFNAALYQEEMLSLVNTAIKKLKAEHPDYTVFTISLTTDFASGVSAVHFDSRASSERYLKNEAEQYQKYLQAGNLSMMVPFLLIPLHRSPLPCLSVRGKTKAAACWQPPGVVVLCCNIFGLIFPVCLPA